MDKTKIALIEDLAFVGRYACQKNTSKYFDEIKHLLNDCNFVIANLETPFTNSKKTNVLSSIHLKTNPINSALLSELNISAVNLANNHIFDFSWLFLFKPNK